MDTYILHIETSGPVCSVSLAHNGSSVGCEEIREPNQHASQLTFLIDKLLSRALPQGVLLSAVAVSQGPGSYTGLRIGVSTAKGLCYAWDIPLLAIPTLDAMYEGFCESYSLDEGEPALLMPMLDARRMEVYMKGFNDKGEVVIQTRAFVVEEEVLEKLAEDYEFVYLFGTGADKLTKQFTNSRKIKMIPGFVQLSPYMHALAFERYIEEKFENTAYFEPFYLKEFVPTKAKKML